MLIRLAVNTLAAWLTVLAVPGLEYDGSVWGFILIGVVIGLVNALIKPLVRLITLPLRWLTLGLFTLVLNVVLMALVIFLAGPDVLDLGLSSDSVGSTLLGGLVLSLVSWGLSLFVP